MSSSSARLDRLRPAGLQAGVRSLFAFGLVLVVVTACSATQSASPMASATPSPTPTDTPTPTATPTPVPPQSALLTTSQILSVCDGKPLPQASAYSGAVHPLVVASLKVDGSGTWYIDSNIMYDTNFKWSAGPDLWAGGIQLVVCADTNADGVRVGSCGTYKRATDDVTGQVILMKQAVVIRVVVARTGKTLQSKTLLGSTPKCVKNPDLFEDPPWYQYGSTVGYDKVNAYATAVSTQKV